MAKWFGAKSPEEQEEEAGKAVEAKFGALETSLKEVKEAREKDSKVLESISSSLAAMTKAKDDEEKARQKAIKDAAEKKAAESRSAKTPEETAEELLNDPAAFISNQTSSTTRLALITAGKQAKSEVLSDKPYYHGEVKKQTDAMIEGEHNLALRANPNFIENCYKVAVANNLEAITKGDIKTATSMQSFSDASSGGGRNTDRDAKPKVEYEDNKSKFAASQLGITDEDIIAATKSRAIKGLEVTF